MLRGSQKGVRSPVAGSSQSVAPWSAVPHEIIYFISVCFHTDVANFYTEYVTVPILAPSEISGMEKGRCPRVQWSEVVRIDPMFLVNSRQHACHYEMIDGERLVPGYYLALWPAGVCRSSYGRELCYLGPFATKIMACWLQTSAVGLGIINPGEVDKHPTPFAPGRTSANRAPPSELPVGP